MIRTEGQVANPGKNISDAGVYGINAAGEGTLSITSISDGLDLKNTGWIGAINAKSSDNASGTSDISLKGIGSIKVKSKGKSKDESYGAKGFGLYGTKNESITENKFTVAADALTVEADGAAYGLHGTLAGRTTDISITKDVVIKGVGAWGNAYGVCLTAAVPAGTATLSFGSLSVNSETQFAYGIDCTGGDKTDVTLNGDMTVTAPAFAALSLRLGGNTELSLHGKDSREIDVLVSGAKSTGAQISGNAKLDLDIRELSVESTGTIKSPAIGISLTAAGTEAKGTIKKLTVKGKQLASAISNQGGEVTNCNIGKISAASENGNACGVENLSGIVSLEDTEICAVGKTGSRAVNAAGGTVNLTNIKAAGDIVEAGDGTVKLFGTNTVDGAVTLLRQQNVTKAADSYSLKQLGSDTTDSISLSGGVHVEGDGSITITGGKEATASITGGCTVINNASLNLKNASVAGDTINIENSGIVTFDMTDATAPEVKLIDYTGAGTPSYGTKGTNYRFAEGKANGYELVIENNDLYAKNIKKDIASSSIEPVTDQMYDGTEKAPEITVKDGTKVLVPGTDYTAAFSKNTDAGTAGITVTGIGGYKGTLNGQFTIVPRKITLTSASEEKVYDGTPLTNSTVTVSGDGFAGEEGATYNVTGSQTAVGTGKNTFEYSLSSNTKAENYLITKVEGELKVTAVPTTITITAGSASKKYDGTSLTESGYTYTEGVLMSGDTLTATVTGSITDAGTAANKVTAYKVLRGTADVTADYTFGTPVDGTLEVTKRDVTLTSATDSKIYDGTPLTNSTVTVSGDGFVSGEGADYTVTGSQTAVGTSKNTFSYQLKSGTKAQNYSITTVEGDLTVTPVGTFSVSFDAKGGTPEPAVQTVAKDGKVTKPADPKKTSYIFTGWYQDEEEQQLWDFDADTVKADLKLYAGWEEKEIPEYDVFFEMNGHGEQVATQSVARRSKVERPEDPEEEGYVFLGWYKSSALKEAWDFLCDVVTQTTTLYANWKKGDFAVRFNAAGIGDLYLPEGETIELPAAVKDGFTFSGWADSEEEGGALHQAGESYTVTGDVNFCPVFTQIKQIGEKKVAIGDLQGPVDTEDVQGETKAEKLIVLEISNGKIAAGYESKVSSGILSNAMKAYLEENPDADELLFGINVRLTDVQADEDGTSSTTRLVYNVKPYVRALKNGVAVSEEQEVENSAIGAKVKFCMPMPTNALKYAKTEHMDADGVTVKDTVYYEVMTAVNKDGMTEKYVEAESGSFSDFVVTFTDTKPKDPDPTPDPKPVITEDEEPQNWWKTTDAGWILKPGTEDWYYIENHALLKGWHKDSEDGYWYYMDPSTGKMLTGWRKVNDKWYYLNPEKKQQTWFKKEDGKWHYDVQSVNRPYGSMYQNEATPDGCKVGTDGAWIK